MQMKQICWVLRTALNITLEQIEFNCLVKHISSNKIFLLAANCQVPWLLRCRGRRRGRLGSNSCKHGHASASAEVCGMLRRAIVVPCVLGRCLLEEEVGHLGGL